MLKNYKMESHEIIKEKSYEIDDPTFRARTRQQGNPKKPTTSALVITIPKDVCDRYNIKRGYLIKFKFIGIISKKTPKMVGGKKNGKRKKI